MKKTLLGLVFILPAIASAQTGTIAEDNASNYANWDDNSNLGTGFGPWQLRGENGAPDSQQESHAGFFIADTETHPLSEPIATDGKSFSMFANGFGYESAVAFRTFSKPLAPGETFSFTMIHGPIEQKFEGDDSAEGSYGFTLRSGNTSGGPSDYNQGARFEFSFQEGSNTYLIYDGSEVNDTNILQIQGPIEIAFTLLEDNAYLLVVKNIQTGETHRIEDRKLSGSGSVDSFALYNRDGETNDPYFNNFKVAADSPTE